MGFPASLRPRRQLRFKAAIAFSCLMTLLAICLLAPPANAHSTQRIGMQTHLLWEGVDDAEVARQLDAAADAKASIIRVDVGWASLQPDSRGEWSAWALGRLDNAIEQANARGIQVLITFWQSPCWASSAPSSLKMGCEGAWWERKVQLWTPKNKSDYANALAYLVDRYGSKVAGWEIWSEPNGWASYRSKKTVRSYVRLTKAAYKAVKATDPHATVVAGALMWADIGFTRRLYKAGIKGYFDAFAIHPYSDDHSPLRKGDPGYKRGSFVEGVPAVHRVMVRHGDRKPLWLTEFGWSTTSIRGEAGWENGVSPTTQADFTSEALKKIQSWKYVDVAIYFMLQDTSSDERDTVGNFGLLDYDGTPKPAYEAFRTASRAFR